MFLLLQGITCLQAMPSERKNFSDDKFFICIEARDPKFSKDDTEDLLKSVGGQNIELIEDEI